MKFVFLGTPAFAATSLKRLLDGGTDIAAVYTKAPQPAGRGKAMRKSPVHSLAEHHGIEVRHPESFRDPDEKARFADLKADAAIVVAYGLILPNAVLDAPRLGCFNLHGSLLPRWRGAAPIQRAIMAGDAETGVQVMRMEKGLDTGPIILSRTIPISSDETAGSLHDKMSETGSELLADFIAQLSTKVPSETPQPQDGITYAEKISSAEAMIDWSQPAPIIDCHIRGLSPFPGAFFEIKRDGHSVRVKVHLSRTVHGMGQPGEVLDTDGRLVVACGSGAVELVKLQRAGKAIQSSEDFLRGFILQPGDPL